MKLDFKKIEIADYEKLKEYSNKNDKFLGWEYCFPMTYIWNAFDETKVAYLDDMAFIWTKFFGKCVFSPPLLKNNDDLEKAVGIIREFILENDCNMEIRGLTKEQADRLDKNIFDISSSIDNSDYIYLSQDLISLSGKKFHSKRNFISRFKRLYNYTFREYQLTDYDEILKICDEWNQRSVHETIDLEKQVIAKALENFEELNLKIGVLLVDNKIIAFSVNSIENDFVAHAMFEKANINYEGSYQMINQLTAEKFFSKCTYVNREEDMGIEGLRKAKQSYNPVMMLDKYWITLK